MTNLQHLKLHKKWFKNQSGSKSNSSLEIGRAVTVIVNWNCKVFTVTFNWNCKLFTVTVNWNCKLLTVTSSKYQSHGRGRRGQTVAAQRPRRQSMAPARFKDSVVTKTLERVHQMKKSTRLPYDLADLQWDSSHRQNDTHTYCYCGNFGSWFKSMVQVNHFPYCVLYFLTLSQGKKSSKKEP